MTEQDLKEQIEFQRWKAEKQKQEAIAQKKKEEENTNLGCGCIFLLICLVVGYFVYNKCSSDDTESKEKVEKVESYDKTNSVEITHLAITSIGKDGGVSVHVGIKNTSDKVIKYFTWEGMVLNRVGDPVKCMKTGDVIKRGTIMGPIQPGESMDNYWTNLWYTRLADNIAISKVQIDYMDGSNIVINDVKGLR
mgnify:CR=1 FL=1